MSVYRSLVAWRQALESVLALGPGLSDVQWVAPTECPDWTVKDIYAHLIGAETWMAEGHPDPPEGFEAWASAPVLARRDIPGAALLEELRQVYERRRVQLASAPVDPDQPAYLTTGRRVTLGLLLQTRAMDVWVHEQDIRRAVGRPGNLDSPGAAVAGALFVRALPRIVARSAQLTPGSAVRLTTSGEVALDVAVAVAADGRGSVVSPDRPVTAHLTLGWESFTRLCCGRGGPADYEVTVTGDRQVAERVLAHLPVTP
jgi:uncharacterized protein (TIGR03083 family)